MSLATRRLKVYLRVAVVTALVLAISLVLYKNRHAEVNFWFFGVIDEGRPINVVWLLWWTAGATLVVSRVIWFMRGLLKDLREIRKQKALQLAEAEHVRRTAELDERERRLDEKLTAQGPSTTTGEKEDTSSQGGAS